MIGDAKKRMVRRVLSNVTPSQTDQGKAAAEILSGWEAEADSAVRHLRGALDLPTDEPLDERERKDELLAAADAAAAGEFGRWLLDNSGIENPDRAAAYLGMDADEWDDQLDEWADHYRDAGATGSTEDLADAHVREVFGIGLDTFESTVVEWDKQAEIQSFAIEPLRSRFREIEDLAERLDDQEVTLSDES